MLRRFLGYGVQSALALSSFALGASLVRSCAPREWEGQLRAKMEHFTAHKDEYDAVFIGSSRVLRGIDPVLVDEELRRAGVEMRSFNFGVGGMHTFEQDFLLHELLALESRRLAWIFLEGGPVGMTLADHHEFKDAPARFSARHVYWHTLPETRKVLEAIRHVPLTPRRKLALALTHLELLGRNLTNLGALADRLFESRKERVIREDQEALVLLREGYEDVKSERPRLESRALLDPAPYLELGERVLSENALPVALDELDLEFYREQHSAAAERDVELVRFTLPTSEGSPEALRLHELGTIPNLFHFNDPERYPELFRVEHRFDLGHLNGPGAERFSRLFAGAILERLGARRSGD